MANLPDFLIIGAMKCGTTTLAAQLAEQPGLFMTTPKEPNFFSDDDIYAQGMSWYENLFADAPKQALKGEASTHYTKLPTHPDTIDRLARVVEAPRIIYMIRNPVARAVSHYIHEWSTGVMGHDPVAEFARHDVLVSYGCYGMQIAPWIERFGPDAVCLTSLEQIKTEPQDELDRIGRFLGVSDRLVWQDDLGAQNVSSARARRIPLQGLLIDNPVAAALRRTLVPKALRERIREARTMKGRPDLPQSLIAELEARFSTDRDQLAGFFPGHAALTASYPFLSR